MVFAFVFDSVGFGEWFLLLAVVLIVVGPKNLPSTARKIGSYYSKFRRAAESFKRQLMDMDTQIDQVVNDAIGEDAFKIDGDEASASPYNPDSDYAYHDESGQMYADKGGGEENPEKKEG